MKPASPLDKGGLQGGFERRNKPTRRSATAVAVCHLSRGWDFLRRRQDLNHNLTRSLPI